MWFVTLPAANRFLNLIWEMRHKPNRTGKIGIIRWHKFLTLLWLNYISFTPCPLLLFFLPPFCHSEHTHMCAHINTVYYAVTLPDPLRQLCISVWLMRVISPKQQNDHFCGECDRHSLLPLSSFSLFPFSLQRGEKKTEICYPVSCSAWIFFSFWDE